MIETSHHNPLNADSPASLRAITGRYLVRVGELTPRGEARGHVTETLRAPTGEERAAIYGGRQPHDDDLSDVCFVGGLPGELIEVEVRWCLPRPGRKRAKRVPPPVVRAVRIVESAPERVTPRCGLFGECGGCQLQHLDYAAQLDWKTQRVADTLLAAGVAEPPVARAIGCEPPWNYRNHMRFSVNREGQVGLTARGSHHVLPLENCPIAHPRINSALAVLRQTPQPRPQVLVRYGDASGQMLIQPAPGPEMRERLSMAGLDVRDTAIEEAMGGATFRIRPSSFFQTNTAQANRMAALVLERLPAGSDVSLVDAYCGVGTFARLMAERAGHVIAIEESASAIRDARWNLRDVANVEIIQAKVEDVLPRMNARLDGLVIDPPRAGCQRPVLDALADRKVPVVVYVSCDPDTLARDLAYLCHERQAYSLRSVQPLDMFPQTAHIETIAVLEAL